MTGNIEAMFYEKAEGGSVLCRLCPHNCIIPDGGRGICGVRKNSAGVLYALNYGEVTSIGVDPIEKKPLKRFHPGSGILSVGSVGCNLKCPFCQNHSIAQVKPEEIHTYHTSSEELIAKAAALQERGNIGIAYTFNEPFIWYEFVFETAKKAKERGLVNVLVTNGYVSQKPLEQLLPYIDAMNIDLKAFREGFYKDIVKGGLEEVKETIRRASGTCHVELTTLVIPGQNDSAAEMEAQCRWIAALSPEIPLHISRCFPQYLMTELQPTPADTLISLKNIAENHLKYVYLGNV